MLQPHCCCSMKGLRKFRLRGLNTRNFPDNRACWQCGANSGVDGRVQVLSVYRDIYSNTVHICVFRITIPLTKSEHVKFRRRQRSALENVVQQKCADIHYDL